MKKIQLSIFFLFVFSLAGCFENARDTRDTEQGKNEVKLAPNNYSEQSGHEDFYRFLDDFSTNRIFQFKRIIFPITVSAPDADRIALTPTEEKIEKVEWELLDLTYDSTYTTRDYDKYTQTIHFRKDTAQVSLRGIDNGIYADYYFKLINGEWYLVTLVE